MLGNFTQHEDYVYSVLGKLKELSQTQAEQIREYRNEISKMLILNLDPLLAIIEPLYPSSGKKAQFQMEIFRSLVLMLALKISLNNWVSKLANNPVLRVIAGFTGDDMPKTSSYYDFINRIVPLDDCPTIKSFKRKPKTKLGNEKLPPKNPNITTTLVDSIIDDEERFLRKLSRRPERFLQEIFAQVAVNSSIEMGLVPKVADVSGDGTSIETGASSYGVKICNCQDNGIFKCKCPRRFSDPSATWGWDSYEKRWFFGYSGYFISTYNKTIKTDLPLYLRLVEASRHDSVSAIFALAEFRFLSPNITINSFISDSASDNYATYQLLQHWDINAVISLNTKNKGNFKYPPALDIDEHGCPTCPSGHKMVYNGFCKDRCRFKWRCPRVVKGVQRSQACEFCSPSAYGRVIYTKPNWDLRLFTRIPRGSNAWKEKMKQRTASERVNNRILNNYAVNGSATRGKKRLSSLVTLAAINVHLDAQLKFLTNNDMFDLQLLLFDDFDPLSDAA